ncbi:hypothetical protein AWC38_SpisGene19022 [Stylophora pistillata]|uniref:Uncharacterized protein n=1 Tax=Stylophora pistillata TaxID=50429 RepID=A0A2B4RIQ7_STYPI|nr:hypothetical protein AWC38_SpisGene19022 [Stylophora pistillata]
MNRELAIHLAEQPNVIVSFLVPTYNGSDKVMASYHNIAVFEADQRPGYEPNDCLSFPPSNLNVDIVIGHRVKLGKQAQIIKGTHRCKWVQVVHTVPEELAMYKLYPGAISKALADKTILTLSPGIFTEWSNLKRSTRSSTKFRLLVFGRGDSEDFEMKGFHVAAQAVAVLNDRSNHLIFVGAASGRQERVAQNLLKQEMGMAFFMVHAHECVLSINEDDAGIGYAKIYRVLQQATGPLESESKAKVSRSTVALKSGKRLRPVVQSCVVEDLFKAIFTEGLQGFAGGGNVIIVIGGDDKYKGENEENRISRRAKRKVFSQFGEEYLDGRSSFIFS